MSSTRHGIFIAGDWQRWGLVLCAVGASSMVVYGAVVARDHRLGQESAAEALAQAAALVFPRDTGSAFRLQDACDRLVEHPAIVGAAVFDRSGMMTAGGSSFSTLLPLLGSVPSHLSATTGLQPFQAPREIAGHLPGLAAIQVSLSGLEEADSPARLCMILAPALLVPGASSTWLIFGGLMLIGMTAVFIWGIRFHRKSVQVPLGEVHKLLHSQESRSGPHSICDREDGWGAIARSIVAMHSDLANWRGQAHRAEMQFDRQIHEQTQRINRQLKKIERDAWIDHLTGLYNRRLLNERLPAMLSAHKSTLKDLTVVMFDLDGFKQLNDTLGHVAGDQALEFAGQLLRECTRLEDLAVRYGGDEFLLVMPGIDAGGAASLAERIIAMFTQRVRMLFPASGVSMTAGVASLLAGDSKSPTELIMQADQALYEAKRKGKRTVCTHGRCSAAA